MINVGIVGCGRIADLHYLGYKENEEARLYAVCDTDPQRAETRKSQWNAEKAYTDYRQMLHDPNVDAVEILTPHHLHESMVIDAAREKKHIACQKPVTISLPSADRMIAQTQNSGVVFRCTENYVHYPPIVLARKMIDNGDIGDVVNVHIKFISGPSGGWETLASTYEWRVKEVAEGRGMESFDHGHHSWSTAWYLGGQVERVVAWIDSVDGLLDCPSVILWKYRNHKRFGFSDLSYCSDLHIPSKYYSNDEWIEVTGSRGIILIRRCTGNIQDGPPVSRFDGHQWKHYDVPSDWAQGFIGATHNFIGAINGREAPFLDGPQSREILRFALAIHRSATRRREVYLDEMDHPFPAWFTWRNKRREKKDFFLAGKTAAFPFFGGGLAKYAPQAKTLTEQLMNQFDPSAQRDWTCTIALHLTADGTVPEQKFGLFIKDGKAELHPGQLPDKPDLTLRMRAGTWAAILLRKKRLETALLQGKIHFDGHAEEGLKLRAAFKI